MPTLQMPRPAKSAAFSLTAQERRAKAKRDAASPIFTNVAASAALVSSSPARIVLLSGIKVKPAPLSDNKKLYYPGRSAPDKAIAPLSETLAGVCLRLPA